ncbi:hypothetical protein Ciccas_009893, partial [Cichlidogyrus casuarinus]
MFVVSAASEATSAAHLLEADDTMDEETDLSCLSSPEGDLSDDDQPTPRKQPFKAPLDESESESVYSRKPATMAINSQSKRREALASSQKTSPVELLALPPGTTMKQLKSAAVHALQGLVLASQNDGQLRERDLAILKLLTAVHCYYQELAQRLVSTIRAGVGFDLFFKQNSLPMSLVPVSELAALVRLSFQPDLRQVICRFGGVEALVNLLRWEEALWQERQQYEDGKRPRSQQEISSNVQSFLAQSISLRRYVCMALTNLTFGVPHNKAIICRRRLYLEALVSQLESPSEDLKQVAASVLRNLSWRTDSKSRQALRRVDAPHRLMISAMNAQRDSTLRTILSALWNLSSHCVANKQAICSVPGFVDFFVCLIADNAAETITDAAAVAVVESAAGILRNLSSIISTNEEYRRLFRKVNGLEVFLNQLKSCNNLTVLVNCTNYLQLITDERLSQPSDPLSCEPGAWRPIDLDIAQILELGGVDTLKNLLNSSFAQHRSLVQSIEETLSHLIAWKPPNVVSPQTDAETESALDAVSNAELVFRRRKNARTRDQRLGYLSVVFETDSDEASNSPLSDLSDEEHQLKEVSQMVRSCIGEEEQNSQDAFSTHQS